MWETVGDLIILKMFEDLKLQNIGESHTSQIFFFPNGCKK